MINHEVVNLMILAVFRLVTVWYPLPPSPCFPKNVMQRVQQSQSTLKEHDYYVFQKTKSSRIESRDVSVTDVNDGLDCK